MIKIPTISNVKGEKGTTLIEALVTIMISSVIFGSFFQQYSYAVKNFVDESVRSTAHLQAQTIIQNMTAEIRVAGNGVPFDQSNFQIGENTLSDTTVTEPVLVSGATASQIKFRLNETGEVALLMQDFNPATSNTIYLTSVSGLSVNDPIYLTNSVVEDDDGLYGVITGVNSSSKTITIHNNYVASPSAIFKMGSLCEEVPIITYNSPSDWSGITRDAGFGAVLLAPNSTFSLKYLTKDGTQISLPLNTTNEPPDASSLLNLAAVEVTVSVRGSRNLSNGTTYTATVSQIVNLRNLTYLF